MLLYNDFDFSRAKLDQQQSILDQLEVERAQNSSLKSQLHQLETELSNAVGGEQDAINENNQLRSQLSLAESELRRVSESVNKEKNSVDTILAQQKALWMEEKLNFSNRIQELEGLNSKLTSKYNQATGLHKKVRRLFSTLTSLQTLCRAGYFPYVFTPHSLKDYKTMFLTYRFHWPHSSHPVFAR